MQSSLKEIETVVDKAELQSTTLLSPGSASRHDMTEESDRNEIREVLKALHETAREHLAQRERRKEPMGELQSRSEQAESLRGNAAEPESRSDTCRRVRMNTPARRHPVQRINTTHQPGSAMES
jgi:hypothetical protein